MCESGEEKRGSGKEKEQSAAVGAVSTGVELLRRWRLNAKIEENGHRKLMQLANDVEHCAVTDVL